MRELSNASLLPADYAKEAFSKKGAKIVLKRATRLIPASVLVIAGCLGGSGVENNNNSQELENKESGYSLPFPKGETWFLTTGPHGDGYSNGVKYAIDIAPPEGGFCPEDGRKFTIDNRVVTASASGKVIAKGDDRNRNDPHHSEIRIEDKNGLTQVYIHLDNTKVKLGDEVRKDAPLGNPSCEFPPQGSNTGPHVHVGLMKDGQEGTMTKPGEKTRTADNGRYGEKSTGIRNDLPNVSNKAVVAGPKDPIPPISGEVKEKSVQEEWQIFRSPNYPYEIEYPATWVWQGDKIFLPSPLSQTDLVMDMISDKELTEKRYRSFYVVSEVITPAVSLDEYAKKELDELRNNPILGTKGAFDHNKTKILPRNGVVGNEIVLISQETDPNTILPFKTHYFREGILVTKDSDGLRAWMIGFIVDDLESIPESELDDLFRHALGSFKITSVPVTAKVTPKSDSEKISISKSPEELYRALASTPLTKDLPSGMSVIGNPLATSSSERSNEIAKSFGQPLQPFSRGTVYIMIDDEDSNLIKGQGYPNVMLFFNVFASEQAAQDAYNEIIAKQNEQTRPIKNFPYNAVIQGPGYSAYSGAAQIEYVLVTSTVIGNNMKVSEKRINALM
ncbi:MAG: M23 family metallopeptidase, partial [Patescibacteria group bacterium]